VNAGRWKPYQGQEPGNQAGPDPVVVKRGIRIKLPPLFEIPQPGRLSISGKTDPRGGWLRRAEMGQSSQAIQGDKRLGELVVQLSAKAAGHELRFLRNGQQACCS
jgi:hypothetical protein